MGHGASPFLARRPSHSAGQHNEAAGRWHEEAATRAAPFVGPLRVLREAPYLSSRRRRLSSRRRRRLSRSDVGFVSPVSLSSLARALSSAALVVRVSRRRHLRKKDNRTGNRYNKPHSCESERERERERERDIPFIAPSSSSPFYPSSFPHRVPPSSSSLHPLFYTGASTVE